MSIEASNNPFSCGPTAAEGQNPSTSGLNAPQVVNYKVYGSVPTNSSATNILDIVNFLNAKHLTAIPNKLMVLSFLVKRTVNGQVNYVKSTYFFKRNNIPGTYGTNQTNGLVAAEDLIFVNETQVNQVTSGSDTIVIDLGDIGSGTIAGYLSTNPQPTSGQNWNLLANKSYFFTYTSNGKAITDFYVGPKPVQLGNQESPVHIVLNDHLQRISTDGENEDVYALKSVVYPKKTQNTGAIIDLGYVAGNQCNKGNPNASTSYVVTNLKLNGNATVRINAANEPSVYLPNGTTLAIKLAGSDFVANTNMDLCVQYDGTNVEYFFVKL